MELGIVENGKTYLFMPVRTGLFSYMLPISECLKSKENCRIRVLNGKTLVMGIYNGPAFDALVNNEELLKCDFNIPSLQLNVFEKLQEILEKNDLLSNKRSYRGGFFLAQNDKMIYFHNNDYDIYEGSGFQSFGNYDREIFDILIEKYKDLPLLERVEKAYKDYGKITRSNYFPLYYADTETFEVKVLEG